MFAFSTISQRSLLDRDVLKIVALLSEDAAEAALEYLIAGDLMEYQFDQSLFQLAIDQTDTLTHPNRYYKHYENVTELIINAIQATSQFSNIDKSERIEAVSRAVQTLLFVQAGVSSLFRAVEDCKSGSFGNWDRAAAYLVGSIEGEEFGGDSLGNGVSIYGLAKDTCKAFDTCPHASDADSNKYLIASFSKGQDLISGQNCVELSDYVEKRIVPLILVTLIQAVVQFMDSNSPAATQILGLAILPFLEDIDPQTESTKNAKSTIKDATSANGSINGQKVMEVFSDVLNDLWIDCSDVGFYKHSKTDMCSFNATKNEQSYSLSDGLYITTTHVEEL